VAFDAAQRSTRHRSGVALRFPRISRIRADKPAHEADRLETLLATIPG
jgi:DNA ligase-1